jgi:hypothetical protein
VKSIRIREMVFVAVTVLSYLLLGGSLNEGQATEPDGLCWKSLEPNAGMPDFSGAPAYTSLALAGSSDVWLSWESDSSRILRRVMDHWTPVPLPSRAGVGKMRYPMVAALPSGAIILVARANGENGTTGLHVARATEGSWEWLGAPLISSQLPYTHANEASIAFLNRERPVVAWSEERNVKLTGLFVALWTGSAWTRLGALTPSGDDYYLSPAVTVDANRQIWLAWSEASSQVRVAHWNGAVWLEVGRDALKKLSVEQGETIRAQLSLAVDSKGHIWVLRVVSKEPYGAGLELMRWDGANWSKVSGPRAPAGKDSTVWSAALILRDDAPIVAWSQSDVSDNHYLFLSEWIGSGQWITRLSGLHVVEGISNVNEVKLAAGDAHSLFVSWDEPGKDGQRIRLVQAYPCTAGETPAAPPRSEAERDSWPYTVDEAARRLLRTLDHQSKARIRATKKADLDQYLISWGMGIRNSFGLWKGNDKLLESCGQGERVGPEKCSMIIIDEVWKRLQDQ